MMVSGIGIPSSCSLLFCPFPLVFGIYTPTLEFRNRKSYRRCQISHIVFHAYCLRYVANWYPGINRLAVIMRLTSIPRMWVCLLICGLSGRLPPRSSHVTRVLSSRNRRPTSSAVIFRKPGGPLCTTFGEHAPDHIHLGCTRTREGIYKSVGGFHTYVGMKRNTHFTL
ncbi:hypothetical protein F4775DRAFT_569753 [Biscogniauxia sp. FL1348]|nr:hypothetical protein F4775DRAFT_569753 [Biscogniauxia sp. FL1348]